MTDPHPDGGHVHPRHEAKALRHLPQTIRSLMLLTKHGVSGDQMDAIQGALDAVSMDLENIVQQLCYRLSATEAMLEHTSFTYHLEGPVKEQVELNATLRDIALQSLSERREWRIPFSRLGVDPRTKSAWEAINGRPAPP